MGLDMYLDARVTTYKPFGNETVSDLRGVMVGAADEAGLPANENLDYIKITRQAAYWRKANQIHAWFVTNVQGDKDDCGDYLVSAEQLRELRDLCASLLATRDAKRAKEELPPQSGFFFGGTEIDEYYWGDLEGTVEQIDRLLGLPNVADIDFIYTSSW